MRIIGCRFSLRLLLFCIFFISLIWFMFIFSPLVDKIVYGYCKNHFHVGDYCPYPESKIKINYLYSEDSNMAEVIILSNPANFPSSSFSY